MLIKSLSYGTLGAGSGAGFVGFQVTLGSDGHETTPQEIVKKINTVKRTAFPKLIRFIVEDEVDEGQLLAVIKTLSDWGFSIQTVTNGQAWHPFMAHAYNIVNLNTPTWLGFVVNELWYGPKEDEDFSDPILPGGKIEGCLYYLRAEQGIWEYLTRSSIPWAVLPRPTKNLIMEVDL